jgi:hypothetical protein
MTLGRAASLDPVKLTVGLVVSVGVNGAPVVKVAMPDRFQSSITGWRYLPALPRLALNLGNS